MEHPILLLDFFHIPGMEHAPHITYTWLIMIVLIGLSYLAMRQASIVPNPVQNVIELVMLGLNNLIKDTMGEKGKPFIPLLVAEAFFIFTANMIGIIPGFHSPTADLNTTAAMAMVVFVLTHIIGVKNPWFQIYQVLYGSGLVADPAVYSRSRLSAISPGRCLFRCGFSATSGAKTWSFSSCLVLVPYLIPLPILLLMILTSVLQTFVFVLLTMLYISGALEEAH